MALAQFSDPNGLDFMATIGKKKVIHERLILSFYFVFIGVAQALRVNPR